MPERSKLNRSQSFAALLGPCRILERPGTGGMKDVWTALDTRLNHVVAALNHPNIRRLCDASPGFRPGTSLARFIARRVPSCEDKKLEYGC